MNRLCGWSGNSPVRRVASTQLPDNAGAKFEFGLLKLTPAGLAKSVQPGKTLRLPPNLFPANNNSGGVLGGQVENLGALFRRVRNGERLIQLSAKHVRTFQIHVKVVYRIALTGDFLEPICHSLLFRAIDRQPKSIGVSTETTTVITAQVQVFKMTFSHGIKFAISVFCGLSCLLTHENIILSFPPVQIC